MIFNYLTMKRYTVFLYIFISSTICLSINAQIPTSGLVVSYPFNGNANDESGNALNGTIFGARLTTDRCNQANSAYAFDGANDNINIGDITSLDGSNALSISVWIYSDGITDQHTGTIVSKYNADGDAERVFILDLYPQNTLRFCIYGADGNEDYEWQRTTNPIPFSQWNHVVVVWNGISHKIDFYINGVEADSYYGKLGNNPTMIYNKTSPLMIGGSDFGFTSPDYMFNGTIDEARIYDRELTYEEILNLYYYDCRISEINGANEVCQGQQNLVYSIQPISNANYTWNYTGTGVTISGISESVGLDFAENSSSGVLSVTITGDNLPTQTSILSILVDSLPEDADFIEGEHFVCPDKENGYMSSPIRNATNYNWEYSGTGATIVGYSDSAIVYFAEDATNGNLILTGMNDCGNGRKSPIFSITVNSCHEAPNFINIPNTFSPNNDGINDFFVIDSIPENAQLTIFSRAGKKLFTSDNYQNEWNGIDQNGNILETGTYWYVLKLQGISNELKGFIYLKK
jgi:gliding motility-associated-like protein